MPAPEGFKELLSTMFTPHPWHAESAGPGAPDVVRAYVEMVPLSGVKLELDKHAGILSVDRPQIYSSQCPTLYGWIPQTYCGKHVAARCAKATGLKRVRGDGDPLDICVLTYRPLLHGALFANVRPIGGLRMVDKGEADDKIIAVQDQDICFGDFTDVSQIPKGIVKQLKHYFLSYKRPPDENPRKRKTVSIKETYGRAEALEVIRCSFADYVETYGTQDERMNKLWDLLLSAARQSK